MKYKETVILKNIAINVCNLSFKSFLNEGKHLCKMRISEIKEKF